MATTDLSALKALLGPAAASLPELQGLDKADVTRLCALVEAARDSQAQELACASEEALKHVPALLRGAVRKLLFG